MERLTKGITPIVRMAILAVLFMPAMLMAQTKHLAADTNFYPQGAGFQVTFMKGTSVQLNSKGQVVQGVLARDTNFYGQGCGFQTTCARDPYQGVHGVTCSSL